MAQTFNFHSLPVEFESVSAVTATNSVDLGTVRTVAGDEYIYCYNGGTGDLSIGRFGVMSANSGYSVMASSITMFDFPIGAVKHATIAAGSYGWLLTRGFCKVQMHADQSAAVSDLLYPASNGLYGSVKGALSVGCGIAQQPLGYCVSAAASGSSGSAYLRLYGS